MITDLYISGFEYGGYGIGVSEEGECIAVPYTVSGDTVRIKRNAEKGRLIKAALIEILEPSKERIVPECRYYGICGGCQTAHINYPFQVKLKQEMVKKHLEKVFEKIPEILIINDNPFNYRIRASIKALNGKLGFFAYGSNNFVQIDGCPVLKESLFSTALEWSGKNNCGELITINLLESNMGDILAEITGRTDLLKINSHEPFTGLKVGEGGLTVSTSGQISGKNIYGRHIIKHVSPNGSISATYGQFFQANAFLLDKFQEECTKPVEKEWKVLELYAGSGFFTSSILKKAKSVTAIEINETASKLALAEGYPVMAGNSEMINSLKTDYNTIFLNPPREGVDKITMSGILKILPENIIYVSCNIITLSRDLMKLSKRYSIAEVKIFDMFPQTYHVETMVRLQRIK